MKQLPPFSPRQIQLLLQSWRDESFAVPSLRSVGGALEQGISEQGLLLVQRCALPCPQEQDNFGWACPKCLVVLSCIKASWKRQKSQGVGVEPSRKALGNKEPLGERKEERKGAWKRTSTA